MEHQAELLKTKFGKAIAEEASPNEIVSIPGLRNRPPKEISIKNLAHIIEARMQEIIELGAYGDHYVRLSQEAGSRDSGYRRWLAVDEPKPALRIHDWVGYKSGLSERAFR